jgi:hypothetical protein
MYMRKSTAITAARMLKSEAMEEDAAAEFACGHTVVVIRMRKRHVASDTRRVKRGQAPLRRREGHDASILLLGAFQDPKKKKLNPGLCSLPEIYGTAAPAVNCHCHVLFGPLKGLDFGLLDPASALQKIPSSAAHALKISRYLRSTGLGYAHLGPTAACVP